MMLQILFSKFSLECTTIYYTILLRNIYFYRICIIFIRLIEYLFITRLYFIKLQLLY